MEPVYRQLAVFRRSLRAKIILGVILPLVTILGIFSALEYDRHQRAMLKNLSFLASQVGQVIEDGIQHEMLSQNREGLQHMLDNIGRNDMMRLVYLLNTDGEIVFSANGRDVGEVLNNRDVDCQPCHRLPIDERPGSVVITLEGGQRVFRSMKPIENLPECQECHDPSEHLTGLLLTDISMAPMEAPIAADLRETFLWGGVVIVVSVVVVNVGLSRLVTGRLETVAQALGRLGQGRRYGQLAADSQDEIGQLANAFNDMSSRLQQDEAEKEALSASLRHESEHRAQLLRRVITAQEEERLRLARDLHDELGQDLSGLALALENIVRGWRDAPAAARDQIGQAKALVAETTNHAYDLILALRPSALDDLGLAAALRAHGERALRDTGIQLDFEAARLTRRLSPEIEITLFRTFQEALTNVVRHAEASRVRVSLAASDGTFEGIVEDDGHGFDVQDVRGNGDGPRGLGLAGMEERVAQLGGRLSIDSQPGAGTRIHIQVPLQEAKVD